MFLYQVFDSDGDFLFTFGTSGEGNGQFNAPTGIAVDSNDNIIVADWGNSRIQVSYQFYLGHLKYRIVNVAESKCCSQNYFHYINNQYTSNFKLIYITFQVFDSQGSFLSYVNTLADPLYGPQGMTLTPDGHIFVADSGNHCFKVYKYLQ